MINTIRALAIGAAVAFTAPAFAASETIVGKASATPELSTLVTAVDAAGLVDTLNGEGPFTVFAPVNGAFEALPEGALDGLLADKEALTGVLTYHVVGGASVDAETLVGMIQKDGGSHDISTVAGGTITASVDGDNVVLTDAQGNTATVVIADVSASNGVVHVIDGVLLP
ncbi:MAG: fasciclin domain-containing protein [Pseudomonadota bacterium]